LTFYAEVSGARDRRPVPCSRVLRLLGGLAALPRPPRDVCRAVPLPGQETLLLTPKANGPSGRGSTVLVSARWIAHLRDPQQSRPWIRLAAK